MKTRSVTALIGAVMSLVLATVAAPAAHAGGSGQTASNPDAPRQSDTPGSRRLSPTARRDAAAAATAPAELVASAQALAVATSSDCQVVEAVKLGEAPEGGAVYEASCATGPGYIFTGSTPPSAIDCVILENTLAKQKAAADAAAATAAPQRGRRAPATVQRPACKMAANLDTLGVMRGYATAAGINCQVDAASPIGASSTGAIVYEVGCAGTDGYRINREAGAWIKNSCFQLVSANATCAYTTAAEQAATLKGWLANSDAANCDVTQARYMGANTNGEFYEAKCAGADGVIARFNTAMAVQQVYPCATSATIGGGCKLSAGAAAPAAPAAAVPPARR